MSLACSRQTLRPWSAATTRAKRYLLWRAIPTLPSPSTTRQLTSSVLAETATAEPRIIPESRSRLRAGVSGTTAQIERAISFAASFDGCPAVAATASGGSSSRLPPQPTSASRASPQAYLSASIAATDAKASASTRR